MRLTLLLVANLAIYGAAMAQSTSDSIWFSPAAAQPGQPLTVNFHGSEASLAHAKTLAGGLYSIDKKQRIQALDLSFQKTGDIWRTTVTIPDTSVTVVASVIDPSSGKFDAALPLGLSGGDGQVLPDGYKALALAYSSYGESLMGVKADADKADAFKKKSLEVGPPPSTYTEKLADYLTLKDTAKALKLFTTLPLDSTAREVDYNSSSAWAGKFKNKPLSEMISNLQHLKYPDGSWKNMDYYQRINVAKDLDEKRQILSEYLAKHPDDVHQPNSWGNTLKEVILEYAADQGNLPEAVKMLPDNLSGIAKGNLYNTIAWGACLKDVHLTEAAALAKAGLDTLKAVELSGQGKPALYTTPQYVRSVKLTYEQAADTYAFLLYKTGDYKQAFAYEKIAMQQPDPETEIISRYHLFMEKTDKPSHVVASLATYIEKGKSDSSMKAQYERLYKGNGSADDAYAALEAKAKASKQAEMVKTILNESASKFTLLDMDGHKVSLDSLKGKTVVVDFWATWCGPCKASFPAMQKLVDHYKDDKNVAVLFVDTWETADDKKQNAQDFIKKSPYTFHVLLDNDSKVVADYKVEGIPTKFVIDPKGTLRFKAVGFDGNTDGTADELVSMVELARKN